MEAGGTELAAAGKPGDYANQSLVPAFLFDLDGTLVDSVYQHVLAWREALEKVGMELSVWRIHRRIGMSGGLFLNALFRETGREISSEKADELRRLHAEAYNRQSKQVRPLPGARELLSSLSSLKVPYAIATSGRLETAGPNLDMLGLAPGTLRRCRSSRSHTGRPPSSPANPQPAPGRPGRGRGRCAAATSS